MIEIFKEYDRYLKVDKRALVGLYVIVRDLI